MTTAKAPRTRTHAQLCSRGRKYQKYRESGKPTIMLRAPQRPGGSCELWIETGYKGAKTPGLHEVSRELYTEVTPIHDRAELYTRCERIRGYAGFRHEWALLSAYGTDRYFALQAG